MFEILGGRTGKKKPSQTPSWYTGAGKKKKSNQFAQSVKRNKLNRMGSLPKAPDEKKSMDLHQQSLYLQGMNDINEMYGGRGQTPGVNFGPGAARERTNRQIRLAQEQQRIPMLPSYYNASNPSVDRRGNQFTTMQVAGFGQDDRQNVPQVIPPEGEASAPFYPTSMPIIEREMDWLNQNVNSPYLPPWVFDGLGGGGGGQNWWGGYGRRKGGGGSYGAGYNPYVPPWATGLFQVNANR